MFTNATVPVAHRYKRLASFQTEDVLESAAQCRPNLQKVVSSLQARYGVHI